MTSVNTNKCETGFADPDIEDLADRISLARERAAESLLQLGDALLAFKTSHARKFLKALAHPRVRISPRRAQLYMALAKSPDRDRLAAFGIGGATLLLRLSPKQLATVLASTEPTTCSTRQLRALIRRMTAKHQQTVHSHRTYGEGFRAGYAKGLADQEASDLAWHLGVLYLRPEELSLGTLDTRYKTLAKALHTDRGGTSDDVYMQILNAARDYLRRHIHSSNSRVA